MWPFLHVQHGIQNQINMDAKAAVFVQLEAMVVEDEVILASGAVHEPIKRVQQYRDLLAQGMDIQRFANAHHRASHRTCFSHGVNSHISQAALKRRLERAMTMAERVKMTVKPSE